MDSLKRQQRVVAALLEDNTPFLSLHLAHLELVVSPIPESGLEAPVVTFRGFVNTVAPLVPSGYMSHFELPSSVPVPKLSPVLSSLYVSVCCKPYILRERYAGGTVFKLLTMRVHGVCKRSSEASTVSQAGLDGRRTGSETTSYCHVAYGPQHAGRRS